MVSPTGGGLGKTNLKPYTLSASTLSASHPQPYTVEAQKLETQ